MGGDHAPGVVVEGALLAAQELGVEIVLVGEKEAVEQELAQASGRAQSQSLPLRKSWRCTNRRAARCGKKTLR